MSLSGALRLAVPACALAVAMAASSTLAFQPSVLVVAGDPGTDITATDLAGRGGSLAVTEDHVAGSDRFVGLGWSTDQGASWAHIYLDPMPGEIATRESQVTICDAMAVAIYTASDGSGDRTIQTSAAPLDGGTTNDRSWTSSGLARKPDAACVADYEIAAAWFEDRGSDYHVRVRTKRQASPTTSSQSFDLGTGTVHRGLAITATADRVYVAWFQGSRLRLRRFAIGSGAAHDLTSLGTSTIATLQYGSDPEIGADGHRVILAYMDKASLKVRRSTDRGGSFGSPTTLRHEPFPSEIGAFPTTVAVKGSKVAIGALEIGGVETLVGKGLGYLSTDGGASYARISSHSSGRIVAALVKVGSSFHYAEARDQTITDPSVQQIRARRQ